MKFIIAVKLGDKWFWEECCKAKHQHFHDMGIPHKHPEGIQTLLDQFMKRQC